jgi:hypothetical protein
VRREAPLLLLGEDQRSVSEHVELAVFALRDLGLVLGLRIQLGRETRSPFVVAVSDGAVLDQDMSHGQTLPIRTAQIVLNCSNGCRQLSQ